MEIITIELRQLVPSEGHVFTNGTVISEGPYLGCNDSPDNWREITIAEAEELQKAMEPEELLI